MEQTFLSRSFLTIAAFAVGCTFAEKTQASVFDGEVATPTAIHHLLLNGPTFKDGTPKTWVVSELGLVYIHPKLDGFNGIVIENAQTSTVSTPEVGNIAPDYPDQFAQQLTLQAYIEKTHKWTATLKTSLPLNSLANLDSGYIYQPEYVLYRSDMQKPQIFVFTGVDATPDFRLGAGLEVAFNATAQANIFLQSGTGKYSDQRLSIQMKPVLVPWIGLESHKFSLTARGESKSTVNMNAIAAARVFGSVAAGIGFNYNSESTLFFQPYTFELQGEWNVTDDLTLRPSLSYQMWSRFKPPGAIILNQVPNNCNGQSGCTSTFSPGRAPDYTAQDIIVPALGLDYNTGSVILTSGYRFKPSIFSTLPTGFGNYLDPPRHDFMGGFRVTVMTNWELAMNLRLSWLAPQTVIKTTSTDIGAPGYIAAGWLYGGGISIAVPFQQ